MTTEAPTVTAEALREQLDDLRLRHDHALERAHDARENRNRTAGARVLGEADEEELAQANASLTEAEGVAASIAQAMALVEDRLREAEEREREERRAAIAGEARGTNKERGAAAKRLANALASAQAAFESLDHADRAAEQLRAEAIRLRDLDRQEAELEERTRQRVEQLRQSAPEGLEPNLASIEFRYEQALRDLREAARAEAESLAPPADDETIREIIDAHAELLPRLVDTATRRALAQGHEYIVDGPRHVSEMLSRGSVGRFYSDGEIEHARSRHDAFLSAIRRLGGPAESIGDGTRPTVRPI